MIFIEDAAHSIGTKYKGEKIGGLADLTCFSFHPVKTITAGEGGAILTNDKTKYEMMRLFHIHGIDHSQEKLDSIGAWYYEQVMLGFNIE